jgi:hypothetical protein
MPARLRGGQARLAGLHGIALGAEEVDFPSGLQAGLRAAGQGQGDQGVAA